MAFTRATVLALQDPEEDHDLLEEQESGTSQRVTYFYLKTL
jgi:hypothetical protein